MATDQETRKRAEELYVIDGLTLEEAAERTGVPIGTINRWSSKDGWKEKRQEFRDADSEITRYSRLTRLKLIKDAMTSLDPQKIYAFAALERAMQGKESAVAEAMADGENINISTPQEAIAALQEAINLKLNKMLSQPDALSFAGIKEMKQALELVEGMKAKYGIEDDSEGDSKRLLSGKEIREIREQLL
nr:hypothetical protein 13 [bacterium]